MNCDDQNFPICYKSTTPVSCIDDIEIFDAITSSVFQKLNDYVGLSLTDKIAISIRNDVFNITEKILSTYNFRLENNAIKWLSDEYFLSLEINGIHIYLLISQFDDAKVDISELSNIDVTALSSIFMGTCTIMSGLLYTESIRRLVEYQKNKL